MEINGNGKNYDYLSETCLEQLVEPEIDIFDSSKKNKQKSDTSIIYIYSIHFTLNCDDENF